MNSQDLVLFDDQILGHDPFRDDLGISGPYELPSDRLAFPFSATTYDFVAPDGEMQGFTDTSPFLEQDPQSTTADQIRNASEDQESISRQGP